MSTRCPLDAGRGARRGVAIVGAFAVVASGFGTLFAGAVAAAGPAPAGVITASPAQTARTGPALHSPALPAGLSINRPTMSMAAYRAASANRVRAGATRPGVARTTRPLTVSTSFGFNALTQTQCGSCAPSDSNGAILGSQIVEDVNQSLAVYNKSGVQQSSTTLATLLSYTTTALFDPRLISDVTWRRYVLVADSAPQSATNQTFFIAASKGGNASGAWSVFSLNVAGLCGSTSGNPFWDYPQVGQTQDAIVVTANCFQGATYVGARAFGVAKALLYNGKGFSVPVFDLPAGDGTATPANVLDQNPRMQLITTAQHMVGIQDPQSSFYASMPTDVAITGFETFAVPRSAGQSGCTATSCHLDTGDGRFVQDSTQYGDDLWNVATYGLGGVAGQFATPYWGDFSIAGHSTKQAGNAIADACSDDFNASLVATTANKMWLNWTSTDPQGSGCGGTFARQMEAGRLSSTPVNTLSNMINAFTSPAELTGDFDPNFGLQRWGDTSAMAIDSSSVAWSINNSVVDANHWGTRIVKVTQ